VNTARFFRTIELFAWANAPVPRAPAIKAAQPIEGREMSFRVTASAVVATILLAAGSAIAADRATPAPPKVDLSELAMLDVHGAKQSLAIAPQEKASVFVFMSSDCPISRQYVPELNRLVKAADAKKIRFYGVLSDASVTRADALKFANEFQLAFPLLFDNSNELAALFAPRNYPEAFLVDPTGTVRYRGRIDDLYSDVDKKRSEPSRLDLLDAMTAIASGKPIAVAETKAIGCPFESPTTVNPNAAVTYNRDIAPIVFAHCAECHRPGEVAPFSLLTYQDAKKRAEGLARVTSRRLMPPWKATVHYGEFLDERRLTERQIALIKTWAEHKAPEGDAADLPPQPKFSSDWRLGKPDLVAEVPVSFTVPADGPDIFQHFVIPLNLKKDETLVAFEFRPGNRSVVHHAIVAVDSSGGARLRDAQTPEPGWRTSGSIDASITGILGVWTPGMTPRFYPDNVGVAMEKSSDVVVQLHLHPSGKKETDQSKIALYFAKKPVKRIMSRRPLLTGTLVIEVPPGKDRYKTGSSVKLPVDVTITSVFPHMHLIGKEMKVTATLPDKSKVPLIWIKDWNFYWQDSYVYQEPVHLPKGTRIDLEASYDNSAENPFNPSKPPKRVLFGNDTTDEMCFALFQAVADEPGAGRQLGQAMMRSFMEQWATANLSPDARGKIMAEAMKLFGGRRRPADSKATQTKKPG
jgi:thiol-disulfide isomerase/thioredoxin/mono/diheme cytochrome c family protein